ncbi:hypothetical protein FI667_g480, partial [Globisporangium splendens]
MAFRWLDAESAEHEHDTEDEYFELSPDDILRQLDVITLSADVEDDANAAEDLDAAFEDAHDGIGDSAPPIAESERETPEPTADLASVGDLGSAANDEPDIVEFSQHDLSHQAEPHAVDPPQHDKPHEAELQTVDLCQDVKPRRAELHTTDSSQNDKLHQAELHATDSSQDDMPHQAGLDAADPSQDDKFSSTDVHTIDSSQDDMLSRADVRTAGYSPDDTPLQVELHSVDPSGDAAPALTEVDSVDPEGNMPGHTVDDVIADKDSDLDGLEKPDSIPSEAFVNQITPQDDLSGNDEAIREAGNADAAESNALKKDDAMIECSPDITRISGFDDGELGDSVSADTRIAETSSESEVLDADDSAPVSGIVIKEELQDMDTATLEDISTVVKHDIEIATPGDTTCEESNAKEEDEEPPIQTQANQTEGLDNAHAVERGGAAEAEKRIDPCLAENEAKSLPSASGLAEKVSASPISEDTSDPGILIEAQDELRVMPPPAPSSLPIVIGIMNPANVGGDEGSDSDDENEPSGDQASLPPPLNLDSVDDDEDELEIDHAVVSSIEIQKGERTGNKVNAPKNGDDHGNGLLAALPGIKPTTAAEEIELSFGEEIRAASVVIPPSNFEVPVESLKPCEAPEDSTEKAFGIGYTSLKKKREEQNGSGGYAVPSGPAFPDEREFASEFELSSGLRFSVKVPANSNEQADEDADDEFGPVSTVQPDEVLADHLIARRVSLTGPKVQDEESIINELKKATMEEKDIIKSTSEAGESSGAGTSSPVDHEAESALSLKELHGTYKRGLGDQGVLMLDDNEQDQNQLQKQAAENPSEAGARLSVMGRILSKKSVLTEAISEEDEGDDEEKVAQGDLHGTNRDRETRINYTVAHEDDENSVAAEDWKEIELTQRVLATDSRWTEQETKRPSHEVGDIRDSRPAASSRISYNEALQYFSEAEEFRLQRDKIVPEEIESGRSCFACFPRPRLAFPGALDERDRVFCIAATSYEPTNVIFTRILQTLRETDGCGFMQFYVALASDLMEEIQTSTDEIPIIIKDVLDDGRSNPDRVIEQFSKGESQGAPSVSTPQKKQVNGESATNIEFTEIALQPAASEDD